MARSTSDRYPAMAGSAALHAAILIGSLIAWPWLAKPLHMGEVVPVTLITSDQAPAPRPAIKAPQPAPAATETPTPRASPQVVAPEETPTPSPPVAKAAPPPKPAPHKVAPPKPAPQPVPKPHKTEPAKVAPAPAPTPAKAAPVKPAAKPAPEMDLAALSAELSKQARPSGPRQSSAARGPTRPAQAVEARTASGTSNAASSAALASLSGELQRIWNPICNTASASAVVVKVTFKIGSSGILIGTPQSSLAGTSDNALRVASERAVRSVYQHGPFADPAYRLLYGQNITVNFNQKKDCSSQ